MASAAPQNLNSYSEIAESNVSPPKSIVRNTSKKSIEDIAEDLPQQSSKEENKTVEDDDYLDDSFQNINKSKENVALP